MNKRYTIFLLGLALFLLAAFDDQFAVVPSESGTAAMAVGGDTYPVLRVVDGDTIDVLMEGESVRLRMLGMNTPETVDPRKAVECFGKEASLRAKELLEGASVRLETDTTQGLYDGYGRMLAYVYLPDGTLFNKLMIEEGYAYEYTYRLPYRLQSEFNDAEERARLGNRGLFAPGVCDA
jgi:micrococcal nuclease